MRKNRSLLLTAGAALVLSLSGLANAGIELTKHNMSSSGAGGNINSDIVGSGGTDEICVFCHTPHMNVTKGDVLPLWNHRLSSGSGSYQMYKSASFNGADSYGVDQSVPLAFPTAADDLVSGGMAVTNLCLSCHDGTQAVNAMFNPPNRLGAANPVMDGGVDTIPVGSNAYLGTDLRNDHPVNFTYTLSEAVSDETLRASSGGGVTFGGATVRLFNDTVQCASCHDPHKDYVSSTEFTPFLRVSIVGSQLCLTCHNK